MSVDIGVALQAFGNAAMILASGKKGCRFALPHARIMTAPPRINRSFGSTSNIMIKANELERNTQMYVDFLAKYTGEAESGDWASSVVLLRSSAFSCQKQ
jgi:ATP-dependent protease ClpP protease subunit